MWFCVMNWKILVFCILLLCDEIGLMNYVMIKTKCKKYWLMFWVLGKWCKPLKHSVNDVMINIMDQMLN
jgi:hypothetical protein